MGPDHAHYKQAFELSREVSPFFTFYVEFTSKIRDGEPISTMVQPFKLKMNVEEQNIKPNLDAYVRLVSNEGEKKLTELINNL